MGIMEQSTIELAKDEKGISSDFFVDVVTTLIIVTNYLLEKTGGFGPLLLLETACLVLVSIIPSGKLRFRKSAFWGMYLLFIAYCYLNSYWARDRLSSFAVVFHLIQLFIFVGAMYIVYSGRDSIDSLINTIRYAGAIICLYTYYYYGINRIWDALFTGARLKNEFANVNSIAMIGAMSILISCYRVAASKNDITDIFSFFILIIITATQCRKAFFMLAVGIGAIILIRVKSNNALISLFNYLSVILLGLLTLYILLRMPIFSAINTRITEMVKSVIGLSYDDYSMKQRNTFIYLGIKQFKRTPILGMGIDNSWMLTYPVYGYRTYLHNNYIELLACGGIIGMICYYTMWIYAAIKLFVLKSMGDWESHFCTILLIIYLLNDFGMVSYNSFITYVYIAIIYIHINLLENKRF